MFLIKFHCSTMEGDWDNIIGYVNSKDEAILISEEIERQYDFFKDNISLPFDKYHKFSKEEITKYNETVVNNFTYHNICDNGFSTIYHGHKVILLYWNTDDDEYHSYSIEYEEVKKLTL